MHVRFKWGGQALWNLCYVYISRKFICIKWTAFADQIGHFNFHDLYIRSCGNIFLWQVTITIVNRALQQHCCYRFQAFTLKQRLFMCVLLSWAVYGYTRTWIGRICNWIGITIIGVNKCFMISAITGRESN